MIVWTVKTAVVAALAAALVPDLAEIVALGRPAEQPPMEQRRRVYIGDVVNDIPQPVWEVGSLARTETFVVPLLVDVVKYTGNSPTGYADTSNEVGAIVAGIEAQIGKDPSWGAACHNSGLSLVTEATGPIGDQAGTGWRSGAILELHVQRRGR
jgi:hypothetical protein